MPKKFRFISLTISWVVSITVIFSSCVQHEQGTEVQAATNQVRGSSNDLTRKEIEEMVLDVAKKSSISHAQINCLILFF